MPYDPAIVANAVLIRGRQRDLFIDHMKLQKLVFFTHAWSLALNNVPAVDQQPEAWPYGPVFASLYHRLSAYGRAAITQLIPSFDPSTRSFQPLIPNQADEQFWRTLDQVLDRYGQFDAIQLSSLSHQVGGPWHQAQQAQQREISNDITQQYYGEQLRQYGHDAAA